MHKIKTILQSLNVTLTFGLGILVLNMTHCLTMHHIYTNLNQNQWLNDKDMNRTRLTMQNLEI